MFKNFFNKKATDKPIVSSKEVEETLERVKALQECFSRFEQKMEETGADHIMLYSPVVTTPPSVVIEQFRGIQDAHNKSYYDLMKFGEREVRLVTELRYAKEESSYQVARFVRPTEERQKLTKTELTLPYYVESIIRVGPKHLHSMAPAVEYWSRLRYSNYFEFLTVEETIESVKKSNWWLSKMHEAMEKWDHPDYPQIISNKTILQFDYLAELAQTMLV